MDKIKELSFCPYALPLFFGIVALMSQKHWLCVAKGLILHPKSIEIGWQFQCFYFDIAREWRRRWCAKGL